MSAELESPSSSAASTRRGRRRWPWILGGLLGLLLLAVLVAPLVAAPIVKGLLIDGVHENLDARAELDELSLGLGGTVRATGFRLVDAAGLGVAEVAAVDVQADVLGALIGRYKADVTLDGLAVHARLDEQGEWNLVTLARGKQHDGRARNDPGAAPGGPPALPDLKLSLRVHDGTLSVHAPTGLTELRELAVSLDLTDPAAPAPFHVSGRVVGPAGPGGELSLDGSVTLAPAGRLDPAGVQAELEYILSDVVLATLQPALAALLPLDEVAGVIDGTGHWSWRAPLALAGRTTLTVRELRLAGPAVGPEPLVLPAARFSAEAQIDAAGAGVQTIVLDAGDLLTLHYAGRTQPAGDEQRVEGTLEAGGRLAGLLLAARERLGIRPAVLLDGELQLRSDLQARWGAGAVNAAGLDAHVSLTGLRARLADGTPLDLGELTDLAFDLQAGADFAAGSARLERLQLDAGPVSTSARATVSGLPFGLHDPDPAGVVLEDSSFTLDADLDRLQQSLGLLFDSDAPRLAGRVLASSTARGEGAATLVESTLELDGLVLSGLPGGSAPTLGPLDLDLELQARLDLSPGGRSELLRFALHSPVASVDASGSLTDLADPERIDGTLEQRVELQPGPLSELLAGLLGAGPDELRASGRAVVVQGTLRAQGSGLDLAGRLAVPELRTDAGVEVLGLDAGFALGLDAATHTLNLHIEPHLAGPEMLALPDGTRLGGASFGGALDLALADGGLDLTGRLSGPRLEIGLPPAAPGGPARLLVQQDVELELDLGGSIAAGGDALAIRTLRYGSQTANTSLDGRLEQLLAPEQTVADLRFSLSAEIARLAADAGALLAVEGTGARGALTLDGTLAGDAGALTLGADGRIDDFWLAIAPADAGGAGAEPIVVSDPRVELQLRADVRTGPLDVTLTHGRVDSSFLQGELTGEVRNLRAWLAAGEHAVPPAGPTPVRLDADMTYDSRQLGALLAAWLPGRFTDEGRHPLKLTVVGDLAAAEGLGVLGGLSANGQAGLASFQLPGVLASGDLGLQLSGGIAKLAGKLALNGGRATLDADLDLRPAEQAPHSRVGFVLEGLQTTEPMGPLLASLHPLFAAGGDVDAGSVSGEVNAELELSWDGPLPLGADGLAALPLERLGGRGRIEFPDVTLKGSPLLGDMLGRLGGGEQASVSIAPMSFSLAGGRLDYAEPWPWTVSGTPTSFTGSIGLDGSLALTWNVPVTERLMEKYRFLRKMQGQNLAIPIGGSVAEPKMEWSDVFDKLAKQALKAELKDKLKDKLGDKLGGGLSGASAEELLAAADELWAQGKQGEARPLYKQLKKRHKLTLVYLLNKDRIKERAADP